MPESDRIDATPRRLRKRVPLAAFVVLTVAIIAAGAIAYERLAGEMRRRTQLDLYAVASLKARQAAQWLEERRGDAERVMRSPVFTTLLERWFAAGRPEGEFSGILRNRLDEFRRIGRYHSVELLDALGQRILASGSREPPAPHETALARAALADGRLSMSDIHREGPEDAPVLGIDLVAPLFVEAPGERRGIAALLFVVDPREHLFPLIQSWPTASPSAESFLVRIEGEEMLYLNDVRHLKDTALRLRRPAGAATLVGAMLLRRGTEGAVEGVDYRGVPVLAAGVPVPGTGWFLVSKLDREEVYAPVRSLALLLAAIVMFFIAASGAAVWLWWRGEHAAHSAVRYQLEFEQEKLAQRLGFLSRYANDIILLADAGGRVIDANERALKAYGYSREELHALHARDFRAPEAAHAFERDWDRIRVRGGHVYETVHRRKDGSTFPVEVSGRVFEAGGERLWQSIIRDISERKVAEARQRALTSRLIETQEQERSALARELHDRVGQNISTLNLNLTMLRSELPAASLPLVNERLDDCTSLLDETARLVRDIMNDLRPAGLEELGLFAALSEHARQLEKRGPLKVSVRGAEPRPRLAPETETALFRIAQEALVNVLKHAQASAAVVTLEEGADAEVLAIADDGRGFDAAAPAPLGHLGIVGMRERAEAIGARLRIESAAGAGTRVIVAAPRAAAAAGTQHDADHRLHR